MWGEKAYCGPCYDEVYPRQAISKVVPARQEVIEAPSPLRSRIVLTWLIIGIIGIVALVVFSLPQVAAIPPIITAVIGLLMLFVSAMWIIFIAYQESFFRFLSLLFIPLFLALNIVWPHYIYTILFWVSTSYGVYYLITRGEDTVRPFVISLIGVGILAAVSMEPIMVGNSVRITFESRIWLSIAILLYIWMALCLHVIADKSSTLKGYGWLAWFPIANIYLMCKIAGRPAWWTLLFFIPLENLVIAIIVWMGIAKARNKPGWLGILMLLPIVNLIIPGILAFTDSLWAVAKTVSVWDVRTMKQRH
jgi:hypothetical protein